jgi:hypothetical protein
MTRQNIISYFESLVPNQPGGGSFYTAEDMQAISKSELTPVLYLLERPIRGVYSMTNGIPRHVTYDVTICILDQEDDSMNDRERIISRCGQLAQSFIAQIAVAMDAGTDIKIVGNVEEMELWRHGVDMWTGIRLEFTVEVPFITNRCDVE